MNIEQTIARITELTSQQRHTMRGNAVMKLAGTDGKWIKDAQALITALDDFDSGQERSHSAAKLKRISELEGKTASERIFAAFELDQPSETDEKLIRVLLDNPGSTCAELSVKIGWHPQAWDMGFGSLCSQRMEYLWPLEPLARVEKKGFIRFLTVQQRGDDEVIRYTMKPEAVEALARLGFRAKR